MKILMLGFLAFSGWSAGSTYVYVCILHGLCEDPIVMPLEAVRAEDRHLDEGIPISVVSSPNDLTIYFDFDKSDFMADGETDTFMNQSIDYLGSHPEAMLSIIGHTDSVGSEAYNRTLGYARADRIRTYAEKQGINMHQLTHTSKGESEPADTAQTSVGRSNNRRVALTINE